MSLLTSCAVLFECFDSVSSSHDAQTQHLGGLDLDVRRLTASGLADGGLVDQDAGVRQSETLTGLTGGGDHGGCRGGLTEHDRLDLRTDVLHRVVDRRHRRERAAGAVDVHDDVAVGVHALEHEQLGHDVIRRRVVDLHAEEDDAVFEQLRVRVLALEAVGRALLERREDVSPSG